MSSNAQSGTGSGTVDSADKQGQRAMSGEPTVACFTRFESQTGKLYPPFNPKFKSYTLLVDHAVDAVSLTVESQGGGMTINREPAVSGQPTKPIAVGVGRTVIPVVLTPEDPGQAKCQRDIVIRRAAATPQWVQVTQSNPWPARDSAGELVFNGYMWLFGGYTPKVISDVWRSRDGKTWEAMPPIPDESGVNIPIRFVLNNQMWLVSNSGSYWRSSDGLSWEKITATMPWAPRVAAGSIVFNNKAWIIGGKFNGKACNDVWSSSDGLSWQLETRHAGWSPRFLHDNVVVHAGKLWVIGGGIQSYHPFKAYRDVWSSSDGVNWEQTTDLAPWPARYWASTASYAGRMWLFSGYRSEPAWENLGDVWHSVDGHDWQKLESANTWTPRHEVSPYVFDGKLWIVAGNAWPLVNDTWSLTIQGLCFVTNPSVDEYYGMQYTYHAKACFNSSMQAVRYRLVDAPSWLKVIDDNRGVVQGTAPEEPGDFDVTLEAYDQAGETARQSFVIHVA